MTVEQANKIHAEQVAKKEAAQVSNRPKRFRGEEWQLNDLIRNYQYADAAKLTQELGWNHQVVPNYKNRIQAWDAEVQMSDILPRNRWHSTDESFNEQKQKVSEIMHGLAIYYTQIGMDESKSVIQITQQEKVNSPSPVLPTVNPPTIQIPELMIDQTNQDMDLEYEGMPSQTSLDPKVEFSFDDYLKLFGKSKNTPSQTVPKPTKEIKPTTLEAEVETALQEANEFQKRVSSAAYRFPPFAGFSTTTKLVKITSENEEKLNQKFVQTSPFALANDDFAMYVARRPNQDGLLQKRIELVYQDGGIENVIADLSGITGILKNPQLKQSLKVARNIGPVNELIARDNFKAAYSLVSGMDPDTFGIHEKLTDVLDNAGVYGKVESLYMDEAAHNYQWASWDKCLLNARVAQDVRPSINPEIERIANVAQAMLNIKEFKVQEDYVSAINQYDQVIDLMQGHPWNENGRFSNLREIDQKIASSEIKRKAKQSKGQQRAQWLSQLKQVNPKASKSLSFKWLARGLDLDEASDSIAKN